MASRAGGGGPFDEHEDEASEPTFPCPKCGHSLAVGTPICGNCGSIVQGGSHVPEPLAASGIRPGAVILFALVVALVVAGFLVRDRIWEGLDSLSETAESGAGTDAGDPVTIEGGGRGKNGGRGAAERPQGPRNVGRVVQELRAAGISCTQTKVDHADEYVASGSCQSDGQHVQINLYFHPDTMQFAKDFYADFAFASVHRDNWWISGETTLMRRVHDAVGGRFQPPS